MDKIEGKRREQVGRPQSISLLPANYFLNNLLRQLRLFKALHKLGFYLALSTQHSALCCSILNHSVKRISPTYFISRGCMALNFHKLNNIAIVSSYLEKNLQLSRFGVLVLCDLIAIPLCSCATKPKVTRFIIHCKLTRIVKVIAIITNGCLPKSSSTPLVTKASG